ncbi:MAG: cation transporter [Hyphomonadaceae bacterium]|nr:cation transporter [Hyphomonadaceae bacterium]
MKLMLTALAATTLTLTAPVVSAQESVAAEAATSAQTMVTAKVNGMVCDFCARAVTKVFGKEAAVENVHVDLDKGEIHVTLKSGAELSDERVATLVKKSGYDLVSIERETA